MINRCARCGGQQNREEHVWCRECRKAYGREWYAKNRDRRVAAMKKNHRNNPLVQMISAAKKRAKQKGVEFAITKRDLVVPDFCPVLGIPIAVSSRHWQDSSPTIDRTNPELGYVPGNVAVISARANRIKNDATAEELEKIAAYIRYQNK